MLTNNNRNKRIFSAILLSITILLISKEIRTEIINHETNEKNYNSEIISLEDNKMIIEGQRVETLEVSDHTYVDNKKHVKTDEIENTVDEDTNQEEQKNFTEEELERMIKEGTAVKKRYSNSMFNVYYVEPLNETSNYYAPSGYKIYEQLCGFKNVETSQIVYVRTGIYHAIEKEKTRIRTK